MHSERTKSLWEIAQSLYQYLNIDELILFIINQIKTVMNSEGVSILLHDERKNEFLFCWAESTSTDLSIKLNQIKLPLNQGIAGCVFASGKAEIISDVSCDPRHYKKVDATVGYKTRSMIVAPLQKKRKMIGVLEVLNKKAGAFNAEDLTFVTTLSPIIAMALDNARMYGELDGAYHRLKDINKNKDKLIKKVTAENRLLKKEIERQYRFDEIIGASGTMCNVFQACEKVIDLETTVLIQGETGTGKELMARCIHYNSHRKDKPFVAQNCGNIPETMLISELFGHKKGAFTGAIGDKKGLFEIADGGTIFLDEVGEMSPAMQTSLLRVLQDGEIRPLGSDSPKKVNTRVISATNRNLEEEVSKKNLREDLFYRLNVFTITMPPLRRRPGDIALLTQHFIQKYAKKMNKTIKGISPDALKSLENYRFPGNVRELENEIERAAALIEDGGRIEGFHLSEKITVKAGQAQTDAYLKGKLKEMVEALEKSIIIQTLEKFDGNRTKTAKELGISRYGLSKKIDRYQI